MVGFSTSKSGPRQSFGLWVIELCFKLPWKKKLADVGHGGYLDLFGEWIGMHVSGQGARQRRSGIPSQLDVLVELRRSNPKDYLEKIQR